MKKRLLAGLATGLLIFGITDLASAMIAITPGTIDVFVDGRSGPWDVAQNPAYGYGVYANGTPNSNLGPTIVDSGSGLFMTARDILTITYTGGRALAGANGSLWFDANGVPGWDASGSGSPGYYLPAEQKPIQLETLMGAFASGGTIVGDPFKIGNGPFNITIPVGGTQLLLGFNDGWYNDNGGGVNVNITETPTATPVPGAAWLLGSGLIGLIGITRKKNEA